MTVKTVWFAQVSTINQQNSQQNERQASTGAQSPGTGSDYDPATVPIRDAATVLILDEQPDLHVLMLQRNARSIFVGNMWVFPGGAVDLEDASRQADDTIAGLTDAEASRRLGITKGGIAFWVAALRETFEEAGVLLAHAARDEGAAPSKIIDLSAPEVSERFESYRSEVNAGERDFITTMVSEGLHLDGNNVHFIGRWITPEGPPRRYDTRFFVTAMPTAQVPLHDNDEAVGHRWVRASDAISMNERGEMVMMTPTIGMLKRLVCYDSISQATQAAARAKETDDENVRIRFNNDGPHRIAFPADDDYHEADGRVETGMLRWPAWKN